MLFVTPAHGGALEDVVRTVDEILRPEVLLGVVASSVVGPGREVERGPAISLWAGTDLTVCGVSLEAPSSPTTVATPTPASGQVLRASLAGRPARNHPSSRRRYSCSQTLSAFPIEDVLSWLDEHHPGMPVVGAMASAAQLPGGNSLALGTTLQHSGAVGVLLGGDVVIEPVVSQGSRPFGRPLVVTKSERNVIYELGGRPALERLVTHARSDLTEDEVEALAQGGLQIGRVIDEHREEFSRGDFLIRNVIGTDRQKWRRRRRRSRACRGDRAVPPARRGDCR